MNYNYWGIKAADKNLWQLNWPQFFIHILNDKYLHMQEKKNHDQTCFCFGKTIKPPHNDGGVNTYINIYIYMLCECVSMCTQVLHFYMVRVCMCVCVCLGVEMGGCL